MQIHNPSMQGSGPSDKITKQINFPPNAKANQQQKNPLEVERPVGRGEWGDVGGWLISSASGIRAAFERRSSNAASDSSSDSYSYSSSLPLFVFFYSTEITKQTIGQNGIHRALASALWKCMYHLCSCQVPLRPPEWWWRPL